MAKKLPKSVVNQALRQHLAAIASKGGNARARELGKERVQEIAEKASKAALKAREKRGKKR